MNTNTPPEPRPTRKRLNIVVYIVILAILFVAGKRFQSDRDALNKHMEQLAEQNVVLQEALKAAEEKIADFQGGDIRPSSPEQTEEPARPTPKPKPPEPETLLLRSPSVTKASDGLAVRLTFDSSTAEMPDLVALVVRIPNSSGALITDLGPVAGSEFSNVKGRIDASGKFAVFQGTPNELEVLDFQLMVTAPVTATVRGSKGIRPFEIEIDPDGATTRKLER